MSVRRDRAFSTVHYSRTNVFVRGLTFGGVGGGVAGAVAGSCLLPLIGTAIGLGYGVVFGLFVGLPYAATLSVIAPRLPDLDVAGTTGAVIGLVWTAVVASGFDVLHLDDLIADSLLRTAVFALLGAVVGGVVAPRAVFVREHILKRAEKDPFVAGAP